MHVCMLAAENDRIPGGKVGGICDVIRDLPPAMEAEEVSVIVPAYGRFNERPDAKPVSAFRVPFASSLERVEIHELTTLQHRRQGASPSMWCTIRISRWVGRA